jgi:hypothetical protein
MADAMLVDHRGFPMLLDLADRLCVGLFGADTLVRPATAAYARPAGNAVSAGTSNAKRLKTHRYT